MKFNLYTVNDVVAEEAGPVFVAKNSGVAFRNFSGMLKDVTNQSEYELFHVGEYDSDTMQVTGMIPKKVLYGDDDE